LIRSSRFFIFDTSIENMMPKRELQPLRIGYARVSTHDQNLEMQLDALKKTGCKRIFTDKLSGAQVGRPGLNEALSQLREADTLVVWKLDRLGRSVKGLVDLVNELETQKAISRASPTASTRRRPQGASFSMSWPV
jgi:predicted site-specific integrase-resolvase